MKWRTERMTRTRTRRMRGIKLRRMRSNRKEEKVVKHKKRNKEWTERSGGGRKQWMNIVT